jgi:NADH dehydrogenase FAD-containing subunit
MTKRIAIVGGGYVGTKLAKGLDAHTEVTLIDQKSHFVQTSAMVRAVVDPSIIDQALIPYDKLLKSGRFVQERAESIDNGGVTLASGERVEADFIVVATGRIMRHRSRPRGRMLRGSGPKTRGSTAF